MNDFKSSNQCGGTFNLLTYCMISSDLPVRVTEVHAGRSKHNFKHFPTTKGSRKPRLQTCQEFLVWHIKNKLGSLGAGFTDLLTITKFQPCGSPWAPNFESSVKKSTLVTQLSMAHGLLCPSSLGFAPQSSECQNASEPT